MKVLLQITLSFIFVFCVTFSHDISALEDVREIEFSDKSYFLVSRLDSNSAAVEPLLVQGGNGSVTYYDSKQKEWKTIPLEGKMPQEVLFIQTDELAAIVGPAIAYIPSGYGTLKDTGKRGTITASKSESGYLLEFDIPHVEGQEYHLWFITCNQTVFEWDTPNKAIWERLNFSLKHRICYDGAYYASPSSYYPFEDNMYYRCPAVHPLVVLLEGESPIMRGMSYAFMDIAIEFQNDKGYWPTEPESLWMREDYGIGSGFYDTRFNCDVTEHLLKGYEIFSEKKFLDAALRQADWLVEMSYSNYMSFGGGYLISDYYSEDMLVQPHSSLNHTLQEIKVLLRAASITGMRKYRATASRLLAGIKYTENRWCKPSGGGLNYGIFPDGTTGFNDYPYLTYNDLYDVQKLLETTYGRDPVLDRLMKSKLEHMLGNGITGYKTNK